MKAKVRWLLNRIFQAMIIILYHLFWLLPTDRKKVVFINNHGKKYSDNCKYILEELHREAPDLKLMWMKDYDYEYEVPSYVHPVSYRHSLRKYYELARAKVIVTTHHLSHFDRKNKRQYLILTWHGAIGVKRVGYDWTATEQFRRRLRVSVGMVNLAISNSDHLLHVYREGMRYEGEILTCGYPRNDVFFQDTSAYAKKVRDFYGLPADRKIALFAPTFRGKTDVGESGNKDYGLDSAMLKEALVDRFGGEWEVMIRWHPLVTEQSRDVPGMINCTDYQDIQELICAADMCLTDYSSVIFDAGMRRIPCFTFAADYDAYTDARGLYYPMEEIPFPFAVTNEKLAENVRSFDEAEYDRRWKEFTEKIHMVENGHASEAVAQRIREVTA